MLGIAACRKEEGKPDPDRDRTATASRASVGGLKPEDVLRRSAGAYAALGSYQDTGEVELTYHGLVHAIDRILTWITPGADRKPGDRRPFKTLFSRPDLFRFEFETQYDDAPSDRFVVWSDGRKIRSWWTLRPDVVDEFDSLDSAITGPTGVSGGSAYNVPTLLFGRGYEGSWLERQMREAQKIVEERIDGEPCYAVEWENPDKELRRMELPAEMSGSLPTEVASRMARNTVWLSKKDFLIRRILEETEFESFRMTTKSTYRPSPNVEIARDRFEFSPPNP